LEVTIDKKLRKYYWLSLLGLIPIFGLLIGIFLLIYSSIKFRNLKLALVIVCNLTIGFGLMQINNYYLTQEMKFGETSNIGFSYFAQKNLDSIQVKLEMYKDYTGAYPDSLMELKRIFPKLDIEDPLLQVNDMGTKRRQFYYENKGESYIVFSSGIDRIPHTKDDLFPRKTLR
jgi:hypothetical protein